MAYVLSPPVLLAVATVYAIGSWLLRRPPAQRRRALARFAKRVDLPPPDAPLRRDVEAAVTRRNVAFDVGAQLGIAVVAALALVFGVPQGATGSSDAVRDALWGLIVAGGALTGAASGAAWTGVRQARRAASEPGPRLARPTAVTAADYVAPFELWGARAMALAPAGALAVGLVIAALVDTVTPAELLNGGTVLAVFVGLAALTLGEVTLRRLLDLPQAAGSNLELAWSDALRAQVLRDVVTAPLAIGVYACFGLLLAASTGVGDPVIANGLRGLIGVGVLGLVVIGAVSAAARPQRHFRQRLWPLDGTASPSGGPADHTDGSR